MTETSPEGRVTTITYDLAGNVLTVDDPASGLTTSTYTPRGDLHTRTDATGGVVTWGYDEVGRVVSVLDALGEETTYGYDTRGNRVLRVDALDGEREWHYDLADRLTKEIDPLDRETTFTYDGLGRLAVRTDGAGRTEAYGYDAAGQVISLTYASGSPTTFEYDEEGRRSKMTDAYGTTGWFYNATGQMTGADNPGDRDLAWAWDPAGRRTVITYPGGVQYRNRYDLDGNLEEVEHNDGGTWVDVAVNSYDDDGHLVGQDQPGGIERTWSLDVLTGLPTSYVEDDGIATRTTTLTHDDAGRILTQAVGGVTTTYEYDEAGQLVDVDRSTGPDESYVYDELGRRDTSVVGGVTTTFLWDAASQLTRRTVGGVNHNYQYDDSGRRTREAWNGGADVAQWFWGARGNLTGQRLTTPGQVTEIARTTRGNGVLASQVTAIDSTPVDVTDVVWDETLPVPQPVWTGQRGQANETLAVYGPDLVGVECPIGVDCTGPVAHDVFGSALETPEIEAVVQADGYDPWGLNTGPFAVGAAYGYRGELHTGALVHLRHRDYDPASGTFLSPDPLDGVDGTPTVANPYHYSDNDPLNKTDPLGLRPGDGSITDGQAGAVCDSVGGRLVWWGDTGSKVCMEPGIGEGSSCWPPQSPGGNPIVMHQGSCAVKTVEITCARGPSFLDPICRNADTITAVLTVIAVGALGVATGGAAIVAIGGSAGIAIPTGGSALALAGGGSLAGGGAIVLSPAAAGALTGSVAGLGSLIHMAQNADGSGGPKSPQNFGSPTNAPRKPPGPNEIPQGFRVRVGPKTADYPNGYWRMYNQQGQPVNPSTLKPPGNVTRPQFQARTHVPCPSGGC